MSTAPSPSQASGQAVVAVSGLAKRFGEVSAVEDLDFAVHQGEVCGLLGPNGAGKTTTLRMLTGLERPSAGAATLFGRPVSAGCDQLRRVGAMVEQAAFVPHLSGMVNLKLWWQAGGQSVAEADLDGALAVAGLGDAVHRNVKTYSQGMKQRLGFARLLLARPDVLILDEPTNGLDPGEIREIRELIRRLTEAGATVLVSSHHLTEVEQTCSHAVVMNHGRLVASGTVADLIGSAGSATTAYVEVDDVARAVEVLRATPGIESALPQGDGLTVHLQTGVGRAAVVRALVQAGVAVDTVMATQRLEDAFLDLLDSSEAPR